MSSKWLTDKIISAGASSAMTNMGWGAAVGGTALGVTNVFTDDSLVQGAIGGALLGAGLGAGVRHFSKNYLQNMKAANSFDPKLKTSMFTRPEEVDGMGTFFDPSDAEIQFAKDFKNANKKTGTTGPQQQTQQAAGNASTGGSTPPPTGNASGSSGGTTSGASSTNSPPPSNPGGASSPPPTSGGTTSASGSGTTASSSTTPPPASGSGTASTASGSTPPPAANSGAASTAPSSATASTTGTTASTNLSSVGGASSSSSAKNHFKNITPQQLGVTPYEPKNKTISGSPLLRTLFGHSNNYNMSLHNSKNVRKFGNSNINANIGSSNYQNNAFKISATPSKMNMFNNMV